MRRSDKESQQTKVGPVVDENKEELNSLFYQTSTEFNTVKKNDVF